MENSCEQFTDSAYLVECLLLQDHTAYTCSYIRCRQVCMTYAKSRTKLAKEVLEDLLQEAMVTFAIQLRDQLFSYQGIPPEQYIKQIFWRRCVDFWRKNGHWEPLPDDGLLNTLLKDDTEENAEQEWLINQVMQGLTRLDENCQKLVRLFYYQNRPLAECGQELGITPESAKVKRFRCIEKLRNLVR